MKKHLLYILFTLDPSLSPKGKTPLVPWLEYIIKEGVGIIEKRY